MNTARRLNGAHRNRGIGSHPRRRLACVRRLYCPGAAGSRQDDPRQSSLLQSCGGGRTRRLRDPAGGIPFADVRPPTAHDVLQRGSDSRRCLLYRRLQRARSGRVGRSRHADPGSYSKAQGNAAGRGRADLGAGVLPDRSRLQEVPARDPNVGGSHRMYRSTSDKCSARIRILSRAHDGRRRPPPYGRAVGAAAAPTYPRPEASWQCAGSRSPLCPNHRSGARGQTADRDPAPAGCGQGGRCRLGAKGAVWHHRPRSNVVRWRPSWLNHDDPRFLWKWKDASGDAVPFRGCQARGTGRLFRVL